MISQAGFNTATALAHRVRQAQTDHVIEIEIGTTVYEDVDPQLYADLAQVKKPDAIQHLAKMVLMPNIRRLCEGFAGYDTRWENLHVWTDTNSFGENYAKIAATVRIVVSRVEAV